ncbi:MAG TPA: IS481 family transposase [Burkholderiales bacterium]|nr:IS481 family transposase [Burkholderiales bacterium]
MPFKGMSIMEQRARFVAAARMEGANIRALCREHGISPTTGYKWLEREASGAGLADRSCRPHRSPGVTPAAIEWQVVELRAAHPTWGGRKIHHALRRRGVTPLPHTSTVNGILHRHGLIAAQETIRHRPFTRFERATANELWQIDFKGHFAVGSGRCHPLTLIDDHSRYAVALVACANERRAGVEAALRAAFERYGLPEAMLMDNGPPWGTESRHRHTRLTAWLMRLGVAPCHGRPFHPQTRGKNERFNGTLKRDVVARYRFADLAEAQRCFDAWRALYNHERPHQAIGDEPPASRFCHSPRPFPAALPEIVYPGDCLVRQVQQDGRISFMRRDVFVSGAFAGLPVGLRAADRDGVFDILFCTYRVGRLDLACEVETQA